LVSRNRHDGLMERFRPPLTEASPGIIDVNVINIHAETSP
jgi:hypothetical protein